MIQELNYESTIYPVSACGCFLLRGHDHRQAKQPPNEEPKRSAHPAARQERISPVNLPPRLAFAVAPERVNVEPITARILFQRVEVPNAPHFPFHELLIAALHRPNGRFPGKRHVRNDMPRRQRVNPITHLDVKLHGLSPQIRFYVSGTIHVDLSVDRTRTHLSDTLLALSLAPPTGLENPARCRFLLPIEATPALRVEHADREGVAGRSVGPSALLFFWSSSLDAPFSMATSRIILKPISGVKTSWGRDVWPVLTGERRVFTI